MKYNYLKLAEILKEKREEKGYSTRELGEIIGVSHAEISRIENGMRPNFSFIILARLCKKLEIDMMNLLDDAGVWNVDFDQLFYVIFKQDEENIFKVHARSEGEAIRIAFDFVCENQLIDFSLSKKDLLIGAVKNMKDLDKNIIENYEKTRQLCEENNGTEDMNNTDYNEEFEDNNDTNCPEDCIYLCPVCGNCILEK